MDVVSPKGSDGPYPAVICIHRGGFRKGERQSQIPLCIKLAKREYVAATVSYRLSPRDQFPAPVHDVKAAVRFLRANAVRFGIDPERIGVVGTSAGGHLSLFLGLTSGIQELEGTGPYMEGAGHGFKGMDAEKADERLFSFFDSYLKPPPESQVIIADHGPGAEIIAISWPSGRVLWRTPNQRGRDVQALPTAIHLLAWLNQENWSRSTVPERLFARLEGKNGCALRLGHGNRALAGWRPNRGRLHRETPGGAGFSWLDCARIAKSGLEYSKHLLGAVAFAKASEIELRGLFPNDVCKL